MFDVFLLDSSFRRQSDYLHFPLYTLNLIKIKSIDLQHFVQAHFHSLRTGIEQKVSVDARHAVLEFRQADIFLKTTK